MSCQPNSSAKNGFVATAAKMLAVVILFSVAFGALFCAAEGMEAPALGTACQSGGAQLAAASVPQGDSDCAAFHFSVLQNFFQGVPAAVRHGAPMPVFAAAFAVAAAAAAALLAAPDIARVRYRRIEREISQVRRRAVFLWLSLLEKRDPLFGFIVA